MNEHAGHCRPNIGVSIYSATKYLPNLISGMEKLAPNYIKCKENLLFINVSKLVYLYRSYNNVK